MLSYTYTGFHSPQPVDLTQADPSEEFLVLEAAPVFRFAIYLSQVPRAVWFSANFRTGDQDADIFNSAWTSR